MLFFYSTGRLGIKEEYLSTSWDIETLPVVYLIPSLSNSPGVCTNALLEGLVHAHNGFIEQCQIILKKRHKKKRYGKNGIVFDNNIIMLLIFSFFRNVWAEREVPVGNVQHCHLVEYYQQLMPMVLSYSRKHSEDQEQLTYDFAAFEKQFIDRFVHGKPLIKLHITEVKFREEAYSIANIKRSIPPKVVIYTDDVMLLRLLITVTGIVYKGKG